MEQNVNTFLKGLQMDVNPMVQGNDVLSDALNATLVTMNGNEVILLNDMGNRRIDNAYLPPGYEPVGIKEYGGIIYIAAYNPLTNMSLVGSFPSPERKINVLDDPNLGGKLDFSKFEVEGSSPPTLAVDSLLIPLTAENSLHVGDKFVVYSEDTSIMDKTKVSNYENVTETLVITPKNKCYTLALGILNSLNEFVDITKSLVRWKNGEIMDLEGKSDLYKFNAGYFINDSFDNDDSTYTIDDANLIRERQILPANTYAYKLVGPLYLKATLNHILEFNYNIYGSITEKNSNGNPSTCEIIVEGYITYNCPDGIITNLSGRRDNNYGGYYDGDSDDLIWFFTFMPDPHIAPDYVTDDSGTVYTTPKTIYNPETNLYSVKLTKKYEELSCDGDTLYFALGAIANEERQLIVPSLSTKGLIDLTKLGTGQIELKGWRFYNYENKTKLTYNFEAYPKYGERFTNLTMTFTEVNPLLGSNEAPHTFTLENQLIYNGKNTIEIDWEKKGIKPRTLYLVEITYSTESIFDTGNNNNETDPNPSVNPSREINRGRGLHSDEPLNPWKYPDKIIDDEGEEIIISNEETSISINTNSGANSYSLIKIGYEDNASNKRTYYRWFLSTPLLNDCYNPTSEFFVKDYCLPEGSYEIGTIKTKLSIIPSLNINIIDNNSGIEKGEELGRWFDTTSTGDIQIIEAHKYKLNLKCTTEVKTLNEELYPKWALAKSSGNSSTYEIKDYGGWETGENENLNRINFYKNKIIEKGSKVVSGIDYGIANWKLATNNITNGVILKEITFKDIFTSNKSNAGDIQYPFVKAFDNSNYFMKSIETGPENNPSLIDYIVLATSFEHHGSGSDTKYLTYFTGSDISSTSIEYDFSIRSNSCVKFSEDTDGSLMFPEASSKGEAADHYKEHKAAFRDFLTNLNRLLVISFAFDDEWSNNLRKIYISGRFGANSNDKIRALYARVFWRKKDGYWVVLNDYLQRSNSSVTSYSGVRSSLAALLKKEIFQNLDIIYCLSDNKSFLELGLYHIDGSDISKYLYNEPYSIDLKYYIKANCNTSLSYYVPVKKYTGTSESSDYSDYRFFNLASEDNGSNIISGIVYKKITLTSDEAFNDKIKTMLEGNYSNMYNGITEDKNKYKLNKNKLYVLNSEGKLEESSLRNYHVVTNGDFGKSGTYTIVYTDTEKGGILKDPFDFSFGDDDGDLAISYTDFDLYKPIM